MNLPLQITLNTLASYAGRIVGTGLALASIALITRALGPEGFGEYATVLAYLATFQILADLGLYVYLTKEISQHPDHEKELVGQFFALRLIVAVIFLTSAAALVFLFPYPTAVKIGIVFTATAFLFMSLTQILMSVFQKYVQVYKAAIAEVIGRTIQLGIFVVLFMRGGGLHEYLGALIVANFVILLIMFVLVRRLVPFRLIFSASKWKPIIRTTLPIAISIVFTLLYFKVDTLLLSVLKSPEDVGIYNVAYKVLETAIFFPAAFMGLMLPILSRASVQNRQKLSDLLARLTELITALAAPIVVGGILLASSIVYLIGGNDFAASQAPLQVLFIATGIIFYGTLFGNSVIALGLQRKAMWAYFAGFVFNFGANLIVIPTYSYMGAAWTTVLTEILVTLFLIWIVRKEVRFHLSGVTIIKTAASAAVMGGVLFYFAAPLTTALPVWTFLGLMGLGSLVYIALSFMFGMRIHKQLANLMAP